MTSQRLKLLLFSDVHRDLSAAEALVEASRDVDVAVCAGDLAVKREGLDSVVRVLCEMEVPTVLVPGNAESDAELREACSGWSSATVLHGSGTRIEGLRFWGLGGGVPVTPFGSWSFDLTEDEARARLAGCPDEAVLVSHSPPFGHLDQAEGRHLGSRAVLEAVERTQPMLVVCGHIHACWGMRGEIGTSDVVNAGPAGVVVEVERTQPDT